MKSTAEKIQGLALAAAAAAMLAGAPMATMAGDAKGKCMGANACKGQSACATATNACQGQNSCKGQGFLIMTKAQCDKAGGKFMAKGKK